MTKTELIERIVKDTNISKVAAGNVINSIVESIKKTLKKGDKVTLVGFGTFSVSKRKARKGRNPRTGETLTIKAHKSPKFTVGKAFKAAVK